MADKIIIGKNDDGEHGIWVAKPGQTVQDGGPYLLSSVGDMLKIHAQGSVPSFGIVQSGSLWRHDITVDFPELPFIPLVFMGLKTSDAEPFQFPPNLRNIVTSENFFGNVGIVNYVPVVGIGHNKLVFKGWTAQYECRFNYTVFLMKIREKF